MRVFNAILPFNACCAFLLRQILLQHYETYLDNRIGRIAIGALRLAQRHYEAATLFGTFYMSRCSQPQMNIYSRQNGKDVEVLI